MKFDICKGRKGLEDFVVKPPRDGEPKKPLVLEVKSSRKPNLDRDSLRQLDDWVFDISGEETARKEGLDGGLDGMSLVTHGLMTSKKHHPSPHKGVMIFNGPIGTDLSKRSGCCVNENDAEFVEKRNFCIIPISVLLEYEKAVNDNESIKLLFWKQIHNTSGILGSFEQIT